MMIEIILIIGIIGFVALAIWERYDHCPRVDMGYNCKGNNCECRRGRQ